MTKNKIDELIDVREERNTWLISIGGTSMQLRKHPVAAIDAPLTLSEEFELKLVQALLSLQEELAVEKRYSALKFNSVQLKEECEKELDEAVELLNQFYKPNYDGICAVLGTMQHTEAFLKKMEKR